jgi:hypothetical protein
MKNKIEILSPGENCWKTRKIISKMERLLIAKNINAEFVVISELKKLLSYRTWILPTIIINGKIVARGYKPNNKTIIENLKK